MTACVRIALISLMIGAWSSLSSRSDGSGRSCARCGEVGVVLHAADHLHGRVRAALVLLSQQLIEGFGVHAPQLQRQAEHAPHFGDGCRLRAGAIDRLCGVLADLLDEHAVALAERERQCCAALGRAAVAAGRSRFQLRAHTTSVSMRWLLRRRLCAAAAAAVAAARRRMSPGRGVVSARRLASDPFPAAGAFAPAVGSAYFDSSSIGGSSG